LRTGRWQLFSKRQRQYREQYTDAVSSARGSGLPWSRRTALITAFHPLPTFSVRFAPILVSPAGEKVHAAGEKHDLRGR
jgi:hypothetical protein